MNWLLLLLILKLFTNNWSAPIDLVEIKDGFLQDKENLDNLIDKGFAVADETNNLFKTSEALVNETFNNSNSSTLNNSLNLDFNKIKEDLNNFSSEVQKELKASSVDSDVENKAQVVEISSFDVATPKDENKTEVVTNSNQTPAESVTEKQVDALENINNESRSNTLISSDSVESLQSFNTETLTSNPETIQENLNNNYENLQNQNEYLVNQNKQEANSSDELTVNAQLSKENDTLPESMASEAEEEKVLATLNSSNSQENTSSTNMPVLQETVDNLADELLNMASMIQTTTESSSVEGGTIFRIVNVSETNESSENQELKTPTFREAIDSFIDDVVEIGSKLGLVSEQNSEKPNEIAEVSENMEKVDEIPTNPLFSLENSTQQQSENLENSLINFSSNHQENNEIPSMSNKVSQTTEQPIQISSNSQDSSIGIHQENIFNPITSISGEESQFTEQSTEQPAQVSSNVSFDINQDNTEIPVAAVSNDVSQTTENSSEQSIQISENSQDISTSEHQENPNASISSEESQFTEQLTEQPAQISSDIFVGLQQENTQIPVSESTENLAEHSIKISENSQNISSDIQPENNEFSIASSNVEEHQFTEHSTEEPALVASVNNEVAQSMESSTPYQIESSSETPELKQTVDLFINQVADIGSSLGESAKEIINNASVIKLDSEISNNPEIISYENTNATEQSNLPTTEEHNEKVPTFKDVVDAFIEDVVEIGSKLGFVPEVQPSEQQVPANSENENTTENVGEQEVKIDDIPKENTAENVGGESTSITESSSNSNEIVKNLDLSNSQVNDYITTTPGSLEQVNPELIQNTEKSNPELIQDTDADHFGRSTDSLIEAASEIGNNFGQVVSNLFSLSENKQESVTDEASIKIESQQNENSFENDNLKTTSLSENDNEAFNFTPEGKFDEIESYQGLANSESQANEYVTTTPATLEDNEPELSYNTESNNFGSTSESLMEAASVIGNNFGQAISNIFSLSEKKQESAIDVTNESSTKTENETNENSTEVPNSTLEGKLDEITNYLGSTYSESQPNEYVTTTPASFEQSTTEWHQNTETTNIEPSRETMIATDSKIGDNFGQTVSNLFTLSENNQESATDIPNESLAKNEYQPNDYITTTQATFESGNSELHSNTETNNFERSTGIVIDAASEIGKSFGQAVSNLFSLSENNQESVTEIPNESSTETTTQKDEINSETLQITSQLPVNESTQLDTENKETSFTMESSTDSTLVNSTEKLTETFDEGENLKTNENVTQQSPEEIKPNPDVQQSAQFVEYIPVAVITIPEDETEIKHSIQAEKNEIDLANTETTSFKEQTHLEEETKTTSQGQEEQQMTTITPNENETTIHTNENDKLESITELITTEDSTTLAPSSTETTTSAYPVIAETTNALSKFENTLKNLIEQEKLKQQEKHLSTLETSQQETTTLAPSSRALNTNKEESNTLTNQDETTMLPKKFEEELQMAVKALEETTHHHFEEFQNNLKEAFKKFTIWGTEHERQGQATTNKNSQEGESAADIGTTQQTLIEYSSTTAKEEVETTTVYNVNTEQSLVNEELHSIAAVAKDEVETTTVDNVNTEQPLVKEELHSTAAVDKDEVETTTVVNANSEQSLDNEEPHRIGAINQQFIDKFADNYEEKSEASSTDDHKEMGQLRQDAETKEEQTTERIFILTTMPTLIDNEDVQSSHDEQKKEEVATSDKVEATTLPILAEKNQTPTAENFVKESTEEAAGTTEQIVETTIVPLLARVPLQKDINSVSLTTVEEAADETNTQVPLTQHYNFEQFKETHTELTQTETAQSTESTPKETITLSSAVNSQLEEMVTFIENNDTTTVKQEELHTTQDVEENTATTQTQEPLTQAAFMEEQQQQIESTTEHEARTQTAAATSGPSATTTTNLEDDTSTSQQQTTTEQEIYSTTVVQNEEETTTTTMTPTTATVEPEARSLNLPPPKLEYLQNEDGVEIFYGYSIVKHN